MQKPTRIEPDPQFRTSFQAEITGNKVKSYALAAMVLVFLCALIYVIAQLWDPAYAGVSITIGLVFVGVYMFASYYYGDKIVLASTNAKPISTNTQKGAFIDNVVGGLCIAARIPKPKIYMIESTEMNAFATGRDPKHASIAFTTAIVDRLNRNELEGVAAHELSHVSNYDIRFSMIVAVMVGLVAILADILTRSMWYGGARGNNDNDSRGGNGLLLIIGIVLAIFAPIIVRIVQASISQKREYLADASGARLTRYPEGLASALEKISGNNKGNMKVNEAVSHLFFTDPVKSNLDGLFATHPPVQERIKKLRAM
ncbi:MAG: M48 family metallopeptidase [Candidatus Micrarchaeia archaeon]